MSDEQPYTPIDEEIARAYAHGGMRRPDPARAAFFDRWLDAHDARVRRDAAKEVRQYIKRLHPNGLTAKKAVLADIDIAADRMGRGIHANGRDRETP